MPSVLQPMQRRYVKFSFSNPFATIANALATISIIYAYFGLGGKSVSKGMGTLRARQQIAF